MPEIYINLILVSKLRLFSFEIVYFLVIQILIPYIPHIVLITILSISSTVSLSLSSYLSENN